MQSQILEKIHQFLDECEFDEYNLSDTWRRTLDLKGSRYTLGEMKSMRSPGSNVSLQIVSFHQLSDAQALDLENPIQRRLIEMGDTHIGEPVLDLQVLDVDISSHYVNSIITASKIIAHFDLVGITEPKILEIGSGIGLLGVALKKWYGPKVTLIFADLPETLEFQSFLLLSTFPGEKYSFKPSKANIMPIDGAFNFVNTYTLTSQYYEIDAFINCNSMAEMKLETANSYISYAREILSPKGIMYLSNAFGMATGSARTPAEYSFGSGWHLDDVSFSDGYVYGGPALVFMNSLLSRSENSNENNLRFSQRECYNRFVFLISSDEEKYPNSKSLTLENQKSRQVLELGTTQIYEFSSNQKHGWPEAGGIAIRRFQIAIASAMKTSSKESISESQKFLDEAVDNFIELFQNKKANNSEFHNLFCCASLTGLRRYEHASAWVRDNYPLTTSLFWLARYAWIARKCQNNNLSKEILDSMEMNGLNRSWVPMIANLRFELGQITIANQLLLSVANLGADELLFEETQVVFRTYCLFNNYNEAISTFEKILSQEKIKNSSDINIVNQKKLELITFGLKNLSAGFDFFKHHFDSLESTLPDSVLKMKVLVQLNRFEEAIAIGKSLEIFFKDNYFFQAKLTENYLLCSDNQSAYRTATNSDVLRPNNAKHLKYLGLIFFGFGELEVAGKYFSKVVENCGEDFIARGYEAFCELPIQIKNSGLFGDANSQHLIFQSDQTFYYPFGPRPR